MARGVSGGGLWWIIGGLTLIILVPKDVWITLGVLAGIALLVYAIAKLSGNGSTSNSKGIQGPRNLEPTLAELMRGNSSAPSTANSKPTTQPASPAIPRSGDTRTSSRQVDEFYSTTTHTGSTSYALPKAPAGFGDGQWVPPGETVQVAGVNLPGGMIYVGARMNAPNGIIDPCLVGGHLPVARVGNYRVRQMGYWPSYAEASPSERKAYLDWLAEGRSHPDCDIGYVFLFFYGLERRIIIDSRNDETARGEWPALVGELRRLLRIYGEKSGSFRRYAGELLSWIELDGVSNRLYEKPVPDFAKSFELPPYLRLALGQAAVDRVPLPAQLALAWVRLNPDTYLRTAATRCPDEFERLFTQRYDELLGPGLVLPKNRTKLKFVYRAASSGLREANISLGFGDTPDVTALTAPIKTLKDLAEQCTDDLSSYSRLIGKDPSLAGSLEGLLQLPATLWPTEAKTKLQALIGRMREGHLTLTLQELIVSLGGAKQPFNRERVRGLARTLESAQLGMEPHVLGGARAPAPGDTVVLFAQPVTDATAGSGAEYQTAALTLQLATAMAQADGDFNDQEIVHLRGEINGWSHLTPAECRRLHAHLHWLAAAPPTLTALRKKLEPLPITARETIAGFMASLAQSDGYVSPEEVKFLEKIYKALGVETKRVFSDVHAAGTGRTVPVSTKRNETQGFHLDSDRIAALQKDTERVSALLSQIFTEEAPSPASPPPTEPSLVEQSSSPLNLDEPHSALVRLMLSRPHWTRSELEDVAADLDLMLDGALEQINEAAFDAFDAPLCEGDDPIDVNTDLLEKIAA